jgi:cyclase
MLASRVIPVLLYRGTELVKGKHFDSWRGVGSAIQAMKLYDRRKVDELIFLDVGATVEGRGPDFALIAEVADEFSCPLTVGGGIRSLEDVKALLRSGADKVAVGTRLDLIRPIADAFGSQAVVASVDYRASECYTRSGSLSIGFNPVAVAKLASNDGVGEILLNCIDRDGTMEGYDLETVRAVSNAVTVPVIACGGCKGYEDMERAFEAGATAVAAGALFAFTQCTPRGAVQYLKSKGLSVRV